MPALTYQTIETALSRFVKSTNDFKDTLNMVMPQIYAFGYWKDLIFETSIEVTGGSFALPLAAEGVIAVAVGQAVSSPQSVWSDYRITGTNEILGAESNLGVVDDGFSPVVRILNTDYDHQLVVRPSRAALLPSTGTVTVTFLDNLGIKTDAVFALNGTASMNGASIIVSSILSIIYSGVPETVEVVANKLTDPDEPPQTTIEIVSLSEGRGDTVSRFRKFRITADSAAEVQKVDLLVKRKSLPHIDNNDIEYLGNLAAIKHGLLATLAEDNADFESSEYHWAKSEKVLEDEIASSRAIKPKVKVKAVGGVKGGVHNAT